MYIIPTLIVAMGLWLMILGYKIAIKYKYKLLASSYKLRTDDERYPIEIEKKYLRHNGFPLMIAGLLYLIMPLLHDYDWYEKATIIVPIFVIAYVFILPNYIVKREFKKLNEN